MKLPIGLQIYSVRDFASEDLFSTLKAIKEMGYDGIELAGLYDKTPSEYSAMLKEVGLVPISAHIWYENLFGDTQKLIDDYKAIGCKYLALAWLNPDERLGGVNGEATVELISDLAKKCIDSGIKLCYHNHDFEFEKIGNDYIFDLLYERIPNLFVEQDSCWVASAGVSPVEYLKKYENRTPLLHLKDYVGSKKDGNFELRPNGYGVQDFKSMITTAEQTGVEWLIVEQDSPSMNLDAMECAKKSIEYLKGI